MCDLPRRTVLGKSLRNFSFGQNQMTVLISGQRLLPGRKQESSAAAAKCLRVFSKP